MFSFVNLLSFQRPCFLIVSEEEKEYGYASPQCKSSLFDSQFSEELDIGNSPSLLGAFRVESNATCGGDHSIVQASSKRTLPGKVNTFTITSTSNFQCAVCKELLCRPVVLNCGHVYCEVCIDSHDGVCKCPVCQSAHPIGFPSVCLVLEHFLEEHYPEEYSSRKESLRNSENIGPSGEGSTEEQGPSQCSPVPKNVYPSKFSHDGTKSHPLVGCDYCGMYPIIGLRYKCKDCVEKIGFDLCEGCYNSSSKLPGRFNQQHTQDHQFLEVQPTFPRNIIWSLGSEHLEAYDSLFSNASTPEEDFPNDALENEVESSSSLNSPDDYS
ncbi:E3 ubiquitin-protein ligase prt1 [Phtheirospermum japonicum]|uniref:E3 ubiquitin-protein ligase prt1 n=1 Tax=Phtheirospermum japonicum TaxID=374723 RepID=A0A830CTG7_9LAMI|nr:E3 ubiquitin-protein ligase prt1 [Phtheirospermum japonicum]